MESIAEKTNTILKARIALLSTSIGGPDYSSKLDPPPYKIGDDCLACLKDLKRWFKLVDDQQNKWDVAMAAAEYKILTDDLIPIIIDWETKNSLASKLYKKRKASNDDTSTGLDFKNKEYYDRIAIECLQLLVLMTWPTVLNEQSTTDQIRIYSDLKKHQLTYKKYILSIENGKVLKAVSRLAANVMKKNRLDRTTRDNVILKMVLTFLKNIVSLEPGELTISSKMKSRIRNINSFDMLPLNVSLDDISINKVISAFHKNKIFNLLLVLSNTLTKEFDQEFINIPLLELLFYLTKNIKQEHLFKVEEDISQKSKTNERNCTIAGSELSDLLKMERDMKKNVIKNTSSRHSRFGALLSIQTADKSRLTVSGANALLNDESALQKLDDRKKWRKRTSMKRDAKIIDGLPDHLMGSKVKNSFLNGSNLKFLVNFINSFIDSGFNPLVHSVTNTFTTEQEKMSTLERLEYLLFISWFLKYERLRWIHNSDTNLDYISGVLDETSYILTSSLLRESYDLKNWVIVHAGIINFNELLLFLGIYKNASEEYDSDFTISRLFSSERLQLLSSIPRIAFRFSLDFMQASINLTHTILKTLQIYSNEENPLLAQSKKKKNKIKVTQEEIERVMEEEDVGQDEALEILMPDVAVIQINVTKAINKFLNESVIETYISYLKRFKELDVSSIKKVISFFHRVFIDSTEEALLLRIDLIVLFRDMLSSNGLPKNNKVRVYVEEFSQFFLHRLSKKFKSSPSWYINLLFPLLHDSSIGYYQKYGEVKASDDDSMYGVPASKFKNIDEKMLSPTALLDMKVGILVSAMMDDNKDSLLEDLVKNMTIYISLRETEPEKDPSSFQHLFKIDENPQYSPILKDKDFRCLLDLVGYHIPTIMTENSYILQDIDLTNFKSCYEIIQKYMNNPFPTPNGLPSSSYLIRPRKVQGTSAEADGWVSGEEQSYTSAGIDNDEFNNFIDDDDYFKELDSDKSHRTSRGVKGVALAKNKKKLSKKRGKNNLPAFDIGDDRKPIKENTNSRIVSKDYISDSEDEDNELDPIFFENEMYMRWLLDMNNGQLSESKQQLFAKFSNERMKNKGETISDFYGLFEGPIPNIKENMSSDINNNGPDQSLLSLVRDGGNIVDEESQPVDNNDSDIISTSGEEEEEEETIGNNNTTEEKETVAEDSNGVQSSVDNIPISDESEEDFSSNEVEDTPISEPLKDSTSPKRPLEDVDSEEDDDIGTSIQQRKKTRLLVFDEDDE